MPKRPRSRSTSLESSTSEDSTGSSSGSKAQQSPGPSDDGLSSSSDGKFSSSGSKEDGVDSDSSGELSDGSNVSQGTSRDTTGQVPIEEQLRQEEKKLDQRFTSSQLARLLGCKERYRFGSTKERRELAQSTAEAFRKEIIQGGKALSQKETTNLFDNVKLWFSQRGRSRREPVRWTVNWTARQVFYKENTALVNQTQRDLYEGATGRKASDLACQALDLDLVDDDDQLDPPTGARQPTLFDFFQKALTAEWNALSEGEKDDYEDMAVEWRTEGPTPEVRKALAQKEACRVIRHLAQDLYRQLGVRLFILASYEDTNDDTVAVSLDFNNELGSNGISYKLGAKSFLERIDLLNHYATFQRKTSPGNEADRTSTSKELSFELDKEGNAIVPDPHGKGKPLKDYIWFPAVVRRFMHYDWAKAQGQKVKRNNGTRWKQVCVDVPRFISSEYLPDGLPPLEDPGNFGLENCKRLVEHWWDRQQKGLIPFRFKGYDLGNGFKPRVQESFDEEAYDDGEVTQPTPRKKPVVPKGGNASAQPSQPNTRSAKTREPSPPRPDSSRLKPSKRRGPKPNTPDDNPDDPKSELKPRPRPTNKGSARRAHAEDSPSPSPLGTPRPNQGVTSGRSSGDRDEDFINATQSLSLISDDDQGLTGAGRGLKVHFARGQSQAGSPGAKAASSKNGKAGKELGREGDEPGYASGAPQRTDEKRKSRKNKTKRGKDEEASEVRTGKEMYEGGGGELERSETTQQPKETQSQGLELVQPPAVGGEEKRPREVERGGQQREEASVQQRESELSDEKQRKASRRHGAEKGKRKQDLGHRVGDGEEVEQHKSKQEEPKRAKAKRDKSKRGEADGASSRRGGGSRARGESRGREGRKPGEALRNDGVEVGGLERNPNRTDTEGEEAGMQETIALKGEMELQKQNEQAVVEDIEVEVEEERIDGESPRDNGPEGKGGKDSKTQVHKGSRGRGRKRGSENERGGQETGGISGPSKGRSESPQKQPAEDRMLLEGASGFWEPKTASRTKKRNSRYAT